MIRQAMASTRESDHRVEPSWFVLVCRVVLVIVGGYAAAAGFVAGAAVMLPVLGMARSEAVTLASMLGFIVYLGLLLWGFAERRLWRLCGGIAIIAGSGFGIGALLSPTVG